MATVSLKGIQKIYPNTENETKKKKKSKKEDEPAEEKSYKLKVTDEGVVAVDDFNLEIADKEFIVLVGPSGCGKSTTLRMVAGLEEITRGELRIDDRLVNDVAPKDRDIAMVFQNYALYPHMTVRQNLEFPLKLRKVPKEEMDPASMKQRRSWESHSTWTESRRRSQAVRDSVSRSDVRSYVSRRCF